MKGSDVAVRSTIDRQDYFVVAFVVEEFIYETLDHQDTEAARMHSFFYFDGNVILRAVGVLKEAWSIVLG